MTAHAAAMELLTMIAIAEGKTIDPNAPGHRSAPNRAWILDTYRECLMLILATERTLTV